MAPTLQEDCIRTAGEYKKSIADGPGEKRVKKAKNYAVYHHLTHDVNDPEHVAKNEKDILSGKQRIETSGWQRKQIEKSDLPEARKKAQLTAYDNTQQALVDKTKQALEILGEDASTSDTPEVLIKKFSDAYNKEIIGKNGKKPLRTSKKNLLYNAEKVAAINATLEMGAKRAAYSELECTPVGGGIAPKPAALAPKSNTPTTATEPKPLSLTPAVEKPNSTVETPNGGSAASELGYMSTPKADTPSPGFIADPPVPTGEVAPNKTNANLQAAASTRQYTPMSPSEQLNHQVEKLNNYEHTYGKQIAEISQQPDKYFTVDEIQNNRNTIESAAKQLAAIHPGLSHVNRELLGNQSDQQTLDSAIEQYTQKDQELRKAHEVTSSKKNKFPISIEEHNTYLENSYKPELERLSGEVTKSLASDSGYETKKTELEIVQKDLNTLVGDANLRKSHLEGFHSVNNLTLDESYSDLHDQQIKRAVDLYGRTKSYLEQKSVESTPKVAIINDSPSTSEHTLTAVNNALDHYYKKFGSQMTDLAEVSSTFYSMDEVKSHKALVENATEALAPIRKSLTSIIKNTISERPQDNLTSTATRYKLADGNVKTVGKILDSPVNVLPSTGEEFSDYLQKGYKPSLDSTTKYARQIFNNEQLTDAEKITQLKQQLSELNNLKTGAKERKEYVEELLKKEGKSLGNHSELYKSYLGETQRRISYIENSYLKSLETSATAAQQSNSAKSNTSNRTQAELTHEKFVERFNALKRKLSERLGDISLNDINTGYIPVKNVERLRNYIDTTRFEYNNLYNEYPPFHQTEGFDTTPETNEFYTQYKQLEIVSQRINSDTVSPVENLDLSNYANKMLGRRLKGIEKALNDSQLTQEDYDTQRGILIAIINDASERQKIHANSHGASAQPEEDFDKYVRKAKQLRDMETRHTKNNPPPLPSRLVY